MVEAPVELHDIVHHGGASSLPTACVGGVLSVTHIRYICTTTCFVFTHNTAARRGRNGNVFALCMRTRGIIFRLYVRAASYVCNFSRYVTDC